MDTATTTWLGVLTLILFLVLVVVITFFAIYLVNRQKTDQTALIVDNRNDPLNCGESFVICESPKICSNGACVCPPGMTECGSTGQCKNLQSDSFNCGGCGAVCPSGSACINGSCYNYDPAAVAPTTMTTPTPLNATFMAPTSEPNKSVPVPVGGRVQKPASAAASLHRIERPKWTPGQARQPAAAAAAEKKLSLQRPTPLSPADLCHAPSIWCGNTNQCVSNFMTDRSNCGECGKRCQPDEDCVGGQCVMRSVLASIRMEELANQNKCTTCSQNGPVAPINLV